MSKALIFLFSLALGLLLQILQLPDALSGLRPSWPLLVIAYWTLYEPKMPSLLAAWIVGVCCDTLFNSVLGENALALVLVASIISRLRSLYTLFPLWQAALALAPLWALHAFIIFWIDGITRHSADLSLRWLPVLSTTLIWPLFVGLLEGRRAARTDNLNRMRLP
jgi:rod shape-determining protein MreD